MDKTERQTQSPEMDNSATSAAEFLTPESTSTPVRSAKDAINAMYSSKSTRRLSDYLATSAQEMNLSDKQKTSNNKSAASIHRHSAAPRRLESVRPSAASLLKTANGQNKNLRSVRTSLKLAPKKPLVVAPSSVNRSASGKLPAARNVIRPRKGQISLSRELTNRRPQASSARKAADMKTAAAINTLKSAATAAMTSASTKTSVTKPTAPTSGARRQRVFQDVIRPSRPAAQPATSSQPSAPQPVSSEKLTPPPEKSITSAKPAKKDKTSKASKTKPLDSIKNRFRLAPKGYAAANASEADKGRPYRVEDFMNPSHPVKDSVKETIHFYGMTDGPEPAANTQLSDIPIWANPDPSAAPAGAGDLGIIEDYRPQSAPSADSESKPGDDSVSQPAPDNNRYALGGDSPFFLKSVTVEKRPLSDGPTRRTQETENPIYAAQTLEQPVKSKKNIYEKKSSKSAKKSSKAKKSAPVSAEPTVIIPARRRSHGALFLLLLITVILGAVVGAAAYLFLFQ